MDIINSLRAKASELAFETDKRMRMRREEAAIDEVRTEITEKCTNLGRLVLSLHKSGVIKIPQVAGQVQQIVRLEELIKELEQSIAEIRAEEQLTSDEETPGYGGTSTGKEPTDKRVSCPQCAHPVPATATFCPGCGHRFASSTVSVGTAAEEAGPDRHRTTQSDASREDGPEMSATKLVCRNCGIALPSHAIFCPGCGTAVNR